MYNPRQFEETRIDVMHALVASHPLGALARLGPDGLQADHIPFEIAPPTAAAPFGILRAHVARANPLWREAGCAAMVLFQGPSSYVSPDFYEQKAENGKVVPTWNYAVVHAHGTLRVVDDARWLQGLLERLTDRQEAGRANPWAVGDAPRDYIETMIKAVVGIEIVIDRLEGKWKVSQNRSEADQLRVAAGLEAAGAEPALAQLMRERLGA
jgi:transcriptional regulator